jgi:hypothetical protein
LVGKLTPEKVSEDGSKALPLSVVEETTLRRTYCPLRIAEKKEALPEHRVFAGLLTDARMF